MIMTILLQRSPFIMKLIGLFGVFLAISPAVFAAGTGSCAGKLPSTTVEKCNNQPCTFDYARYMAFYTFFRKFVKKIQKIECSK